MRYQQLIDAVKEKQPASILEIGTWNGLRALEMLEIVPTARYFGFDLFEDATATTDIEEFNVKRHCGIESVMRALHGYDVKLYKGNTRKTLPLFDEKVDFVWIDGGHSLETIRSDWENVQRLLEPGAWVFFDDYYSGPIDTEKMGCNKIVQALSHVVLPMVDPVLTGGWVQMVRVYP